MAATLVGASNWSMTTDAEGHRTYKISWKVRTDDKDDGPLVVSQCTGLPAEGSFWLFGNDVDTDAFRLPSQEVRKNPAVKEDNPFRDWVVDQTFSTKPVDPSKQRCNSTTVGDPLLEPMKISGSFVQYVEEATHDRFGNPIVNSAWEQIRGPQNEWDNYRASVEVEQNVAVLDLETVSHFINNPLNSQPMWGVIARGVKLSRFSWERKYFGSCYAYFTRKFGFDVNVRKHPNTGEIVSGWDRDVLDEGTKVLRGSWDMTTSPPTWTLRNDASGNPPNRYNPRDFIAFPDYEGNKINGMLDGTGKPAGGTFTPGQHGPWLVSIVAGSIHEPGDTQNPDHWITLRDDPTNVPAWQASTKYVYGAVRTNGGSTYVQNNPAGSTGTPGSSLDWTQITLTDRGLYDIEDWDTYELGHYVSVAPDVFSGVGTIHVERYGESNLLYLNLPLFLG